MTMIFTGSTYQLALRTQLEDITDDLSWVSTGALDDTGTKVGFSPALPLAKQRIAQCVPHLRASEAHRRRKSMQYVIHFDANDSLFTNSLRDGDIGQALAFAPCLSFSTAT